MDLQVNISDVMAAVVPLVKDHSDNLLTYVVVGFSLIKATII